MDTKLDGLDAQPNLSARQKEFCANLAAVIRKPEFDLLDTAGISLAIGGDRVQLVLPHRTESELTIFVVLSKGSLATLRVWDFEFANVFESLFSQQDSPDMWVLKITNLLLGKVFLEKWMRGRSIVRSRSSHYSSELGKWVIGSTTQTRKRWFITSTRSVPAEEGPPDGTIHQEKHVCFCSAHGIPKFSGTV